MAKGEKVHVSSDPSSDEYDSCDENIEELKATMIKKFGKKVYTKIKMLMKKRGIDARRHNHSRERQEPCT